MFAEPPGQTRMPRSDRRCTRSAISMWTLPAPPSPAHLPKAQKGFCRSDHPKITAFFVPFVPYTHARRKMNGLSAAQAPGNPQPKAQPVGRDNSLPVPKADGNLSFVLNKVDDISFEQRGRKELKEGEVEVNIRQTGAYGRVEVGTVARTGLI